MLASKFTLKHVAKLFFTWHKNNEFLYIHKPFSPCLRGNKISVYVIINVKLDKLEK
jgi:hypothetical protein